jgi:hypothetical protein
MCLEERLLMKECINKINIWITNRPKFKQYLWLIGLWLFGLITVSIATYPLKLLMRLLK